MNIKVLDAKEPVRDAAGFITLQVLFEHLKDLGYVPFSARPDDVEEHGRVLFEAAEAGEYGEVAAFVRPDVSIYDLQSELDKLMPDIMLGLATPEEISLAKSLRLQIKAMS